MRKYVFEARMEVRDYECDIEGIVNNAGEKGWKLSSVASSQWELINPQGEGFREFPGW